MKINDYIRIEDGFDIVNFFKLCNDNDIQIEYVKNFNIEKLTAMRQQRIDSMLYGPAGFFQSIDEALYTKDGGFPEWSRSNNNKANSDFWIHRWMIQSLLDDKFTLPFTLVTTNSNRYTKDDWDIIRKNYSFSYDDYIENNIYLSQQSFHLHPGGTRLDALYFMGFTNAPIILFTKKSQKFDYGGYKFKSFDDLKSWCLKNISNKTFSKTQYFVHIESDDDFLNLDNNPMKMLKFNMLLRGGDLRYLIWDWDSRESYSFLVRNSLPYKIYVGNCKNEEDYIQTCNRIKKSAENVPDDIDYKHALTIDRELNFFPTYTKTYGFELEFEKYEGDINNIPEKNNYKGFCLYTDSNILWDRNIWEMFYYGNTNVALRKLNDEVVFFNTEHVSWKYTKTPIEYTRTLPKVYYKSFI